MSHSVPSESSAVDTTFIIGADLVQFDRPELPIYQTPESQTPHSKWAEACFDEAPYGAPLDRLFGEPGDLHIDSVVREESQAALTALPGDDPLVITVGEGNRKRDVKSAHSQGTEPPYPGMSQAMAR